MMGAVQRKRYCEYGITLLVLLSLIGIWVIGRPLESLDELWQYSVGSHMARGLLPYRDINMVVPPLSGFLGGAAISLLGDELIVYRILGTLVCTACMMLFYDILRIMKTERRLAFCLCVYVTAFYGMHFTYDYNYLVLLMILLIMELLLRQEMPGKGQSCVSWPVIGLAAGCAVLFKQSTGLAVLAVTSLLAGRRILCYGVGCILPLGAFVSWLLRLHIAEEFRRYALGGLGSFRQYNKTSLWTFLFQGGPLCTVEAGLAMLILAAGIRRLVSGRGTQAQRKWLVLYGLSAAGMTVAYPIADETHFVIALLPLLIPGICELPAAKACRQKIPVWLATAAALTGMGISLWCIREDSAVWSGLAHYQGIRIDSDVEKLVEEIDAYIEQQPGVPVYILDGAAVLYKIPLERYDKDYDMCLAGNWGDRSTDEMAQALLQRGGLMLLAADGYGVNWQVPEDFLKYIKCHAVCVDHIGKYDVYVADDQLEK